MKTTTKTAVVLTGLLGAGSLLAYGPAFEVPAYFGHHYSGPHHGAWGGHYSGDPAEDEKRVEAWLEQMKIRLNISPEQAPKWNQFEDRLKTHATMAREVHGTLYSQRGPASAQQDNDLRTQLWQHRLEVQQAAAELLASLNPEQRALAGDLFDRGPHHVLY